MNCKNCHQELQESDHFCRNCGARIIDQRITIPNLTGQFSQQFLNYDNLWLQTFLAMFRQPEAVIGGYLSGIRKRFVNPVGYFAIALTFSGFFYFIFLKWFPELFNFSESIYQIDDAQRELSQEIASTAFDYQSLMFFLFIPILALISRLMFLKNGTYNYAEHLIINLYTYSHVSVVITMLYLITIWILPLFMVVSLLALPLQIVYFAFVFKQLYQVSTETIVLKTLLFLLIVLPLCIGLLVLLMVILNSIGVFDSLTLANEIQQGSTNAYQELTAPIQSMTLWI